MYTRALRLSVGAIAFTHLFTPIASRPLVEDDISDILPREADGNDLACRQFNEQVTSVVTVTVQATTTDFFTTITTTEGAGNAGVVGGQGGQNTWWHKSSHPASIPDPVQSTKAVSRTSTPLLGIQTAESTSHSQVAAPTSSTSSSGSSSDESGGACTTGDSVTDLGFYIANYGSVRATYYIYASINATNTSEEVPYKCADIIPGDKIFVSIPPGLNGRINRGLPYSQTTDHPSRGPASWFEFNHVISTNTLWGDISLIQGYDGAISVEGADGSFGFTSALPMWEATASYSAALTTKTGYPSNIPAPTVIAPTVANDTVYSNQQAYAFYTDGYPNGPCGNLQNGTYASNYWKFNPNYMTSNNIFSVTFHEGLV